MRLKLLIGLVVFATNSFATQQIVNLTFEPPKGFEAKRSGNIYQYVGSKNKPSDTLITAQYLKPISQSLVKEMKAQFRKDSRRMKVLKAGKATRLKLAKPFQGIVVKTLVQKKGGGKFYIYNFMVSEGMNAYYFQLVATGNQAQHKAALEQDMQPLFDSLKFKPADFEANKISGSTAKSSLFGFEMEYPVSYKKTEKNDPLFSYQVETARSFEGGAYNFPMLIYTVVGKPSNPYVFLKNWVEKSLYGKFFKKKKKHTMQPFYAQVWQTKEGQGGITYKVTAFQGREFLAHLSGVLVIKNNGVMAIGSVMTYNKLKKNLHSAASKAYDQLVAEHQTMLAKADFNIPKNRYVDVEKYLVKKKEYYYSYEVSISYDITSFYSKDAITYSFFNDLTCKVKTDDYMHAMTDYNADYFDNTSGVSSISGDGGGKKKSSPFRVLGTSKDDMYLYIQRGGIGTFHSLKVNATGKYGPYKLKGLAIDGKIEGRYSSGNNYKVYKK